MRWIILMLLLAFYGMLNTAICVTTADAAIIPASDDLYLDLGKMQIHNIDLLWCDTGHEKGVNFRNISIIQFNLSGLNISDNDIGILVLKAEYMGQGAGPIENNTSEFAGISIIPIESNWSESADMNTILLNMQPAFNRVLNNDTSQLSTCLDGDKIFAFDISMRLKDARSKENRLSFFLMAVSDRSFSVQFKSRESSEAPCLIVIPYPSGGN